MRLSEETELTLVLPKPWTPDSTTLPLPSKSVLRSLMRRWLSTKRWLRCTSETMCPQISTDGSSPNTPTSESVPELSSTVPPSSNTKRPFATAPERKLPEEKSSRLRLTPSLSTTDPVVSKDVSLLLEMLLDTSPSALERVSTSLQSLDVWPLRKLSH